MFCCRNCDRKFEVWVWGWFWVFFVRVGGGGFKHIIKVFYYRNNNRKAQKIKIRKKGILQKKPEESSKCKKKGWKRFFFLDAEIAVENPEKTPLEINLFMLQKLAVKIP